MKWLDDAARTLAYPLRATWVDKMFIVIEITCVVALAAIGVIALGEHFL